MPCNELVTFSWGHPAISLITGGRLQQTPAALSAGESRHQQWMAGWMDG